MVGNSEMLASLEKLRRGKAILERRNEGFRVDGYTNMLNKYGTKQDNSEAYRFQSEEMVSDLELMNLYEGNGLFTKIIDRPSEEAIKHGFDIDYGDDKTSEYVESKMDALQVEDHFATAEKWARLFGGAIIVMLVDDGRGLEEPLDWNSVRSVEELRVFERSIVQPDYTSLYSFDFDITEKNRPIGQSEYYDVFSQYGTFRVHYTRCLVFRNGRLPEHTTNAIYRHWGIPEYVKIKRALRETITSHTDGVKLLERCVQAIYKMKNLANLLTTDKGEDTVIRRMQVIDMARGILNSLAIDAEGEDYDFKTLQMSGVKDILDATCNMLSAVTDIPQTILFGRSPAGENSTGENDMENYYSMVEKIQKMNMKSNGRTLIDLILIEGKSKGEIDEIPRYKMKFTALRSMTEEQKANVDNVNANTDLVKAQTADVYVNMQAVDPSEVRRNLAKGDEFNIQEVVTEEEINIPNGALDLSGIRGADGEGATAAAVIFCKEGRVLAGLRSGDEGLCGAGGKVEEGESCEEAAAREAFEEFSMVPHKLIPLGVLKRSTQAYRDCMIYLCVDFTGKERPDGEEILSSRWYSLNELFQGGQKLFPPFRESLEFLISKMGSVNANGTGG